MDILNELARYADVLCPNPCLSSRSRHTVTWTDPFILARIHRSNMSENVDREMAEEEQNQISAPLSLFLSYLYNEIGYVCSTTRQQVR